MVKKQSSVTEKKKFLNPQRPWFVVKEPLFQKPKRQTGDHRASWFTRTSPKQEPLLKLASHHWFLSLGVEKSDSKTPVGGGQALGILTSKGMTRFSEKMASHRDGWEKRNTPFWKTPECSQRKLVNQSRTHWAFIRVHASATLERVIANLSYSCLLPGRRKVPHTIHLSIYPHGEWEEKHWTQLWSLLRRLWDPIKGLSCK